MDIPLHVIQDALAAYGPTLCSLPDEAEFTRVRLAGGSSREPKTLYVGAATEYTPQYSCEGSAFVSIGRSEADLYRSIVLSNHDSTQEIVDLLQTLFDTFSSYQVALLKALSTGDYQDIVDIGQRFMHNPIVFVDSGYRLYALSPRVVTPFDQEWAYLAEQGYFSLETIRALRDAGELEAASLIGTASLFYSQVFETKSIVANLFINTNFGGRVIILEKTSPLMSRDVFAAKLLVEILEAKMAADETFKHIQGKEYLDSLLYDLVSGVSLSKKLIADRLQYLATWNSGCFRALVVDFSTSNDQSVDYYSNVLKNNVDSHSVLFENKFVSVLHYSSPEVFSASYVRVTEFLLDNGLTGGISNEFTDLSEFYDYYSQALACLELGSKDRFIHLYSDYMLEHIVAFAPLESRHLLCHPAVTLIKAYDVENSTQFARTLHGYIQNERSLVKTAEELYIHRNTLLYRLGKIDALFKLDLDEPRLRLHLLLSFEFLSEGT